MSDWPDSLPGLNLKKALSQLGGKKSLYVRLLGMFQDSHNNDVNRLVDAANSQDWRAVHDINHALKGVTGNIAADELAHLCTSLDHKIKKQDHDIQAVLEAMPLAMDTLLASAKEAQNLPVD